MHCLSAAIRCVSSGLAVVLLVGAGGLAACGGDANSDNGNPTGGTGLSIPVTVVKTDLANRCGTPYGMCMLPGALAKGLACYCPTMYGAVPGTAM